jgi:CHRD domain/PEP-CTERM motif
MKLTPLILAAAAALAFAAPASAVEKTYSTTLSGAAEAPVNASPGTGAVLVTIDTTAFTMHVQASFANLSAPNTAAHIHCCTAAPGTGTAGVATVTPTFTGFPSGTTSGSYDRVFDMTLASSWNPAFVTAHGGTTAIAFADLVAGFDAGTTYFNVHTTAFPGGEIRGFLAAPVPEPSSYALMLAGLGVVGVVLRRRIRPV